MSPNKTIAQDTHLFSYVISSADMRHIERTERQIFLRHTQDGEPFLRGELPDCGPSCHATLGQILLEYVMSCEGCKDDIIEADMARAFGTRLGTSLIKKLRFSSAERDVAGRLQEALRCVSNSLDDPFTVEQTADQFRCSFEQGPIAVAAQNAGIKRGQPMARRALLAVFDALVPELAPGWHVAAVSGVEQPLTTFTVATSG